MLAPWRNKSIQHNGVLWLCFTPKVLFVLMSTILAAAWMSPGLPWPSLKTFVAPRRPQYIGSWRLTLNLIISLERFFEQARAEYHALYMPPYFRCWNFRQWKKDCLLCASSNIYIYIYILTERVNCDWKWDIVFSLCDRWYVPLQPCFPKHMFQANVGEAWKKRLRWGRGPREKTVRKVGKFAFQQQPGRHRTQTCV